MEQFSKYIIKKIADLSIIEDEELQNYEYTLQILLEQMITYGSVFIIAAFQKRILETIVFLISFSSLRKRTGGFHLPSFWVCYIFSVSIYLTYAFILFPLLKEYGGLNFFVFILSAVFVLVKGAVNNDSIHWNRSEYKCACTASRLIVIIEVGCMIFIGYFLSIIDIALYLSFGTILAASLLGVEILFQRLNNRVK